MTAKMKADLIARYGRANYQRLPWRGSEDETKRGQRTPPAARKYEEAEEERLREEMIQARVEFEVAKRLAEQRPPLKRSEMNAAAKSRYIRAKGKAEYDKLPW